MAHRNDFIYRKMESEANNNQESNNDRLTKISKCIEMLEHTMNCSNTNCPLQGCMKIRSILIHNKTCRRKSNGSCPYCKQLIALCVYHAKHCARSHCKTPYCTVIKNKISQKNMQARLSKALKQPTTSSFLKLQQWNQPKHLIDTMYATDKPGQTLGEPQRVPQEPIKEPIKEPRQFRGIFNSSRLSERQEIRDSFTTETRELCNWPMQNIPRILPRPGIQYSFSEPKVSFAPKSSWSSVPWPATTTSAPPRIPSYAELATPSYTELTTPSYTEMTTRSPDSPIIPSGINTDTIKDLSYMMGEDYLKLRAEIVAKLQLNRTASADINSAHMDTTAN